jgi:hypothetical protein
MASEKIIDLDLYLDSALSALSFEEELWCTRLLYFLVLPY